MSESKPHSLLPLEFISRLESILPRQAYKEAIKSFSNPKRSTFRVNTLKSDAASIQKELEAEGFSIEAVAGIPNAFRVLELNQRRALTQSKAFYEGRIYIQNLSSILAPLILNPKAGERILDLAAAPGGKTLMMAAMMLDTGWISAVEPVKERFYRLKRNIKNSGASIIHSYQKDGRGIGRTCSALFDRVLLDAPCSSEAKFTTLNPKTYAYWSPRKIKESQRLQKRLILSAWQSLKAGGRLLYSTCSFSPEENEAVVDFLLKRAPDAKIVPIDLPVSNTMEGLVYWQKKDFNPTLKLTRRILPNDEMDGFFLALIEKSL